MASVIEKWFLGPLGPQRSQGKDKTDGQMVTDPLPVCDSGGSMALAFSNMPWQGQRTAWAEGLLGGWAVVQEESHTFSPSRNKTEQRTMGYTHRGTSVNSGRANE